MSNVIKAALFFLTSLLFACAGTPPKIITNPQGLLPCPSSPNCVSSFAELSDPHYIGPLDSKLSIVDKSNRLHQLLSAKSNIEVIHSETHYLRAEATSSFWGFVDDLEFIFTDDQIHMRSASRLGYSDLGANRRRLESIRLEF